MAARFIRTFLVDIMNGYDLSRMFIDFSFENPSKIKPNHYALYFFSIEHCNRLGWKKEFGLPTTMAMEAIGIKSYNTYINTFNELIDFGFFKLIQRSKNQYSANIIELSNNDKALDKALDKAFIKHATKQSESTSESISSINKPINNKPINNKPIYLEKEFLEDWKKVRLHFHKAPTNIKKLGTFESRCFDLAIKDFSKEDIRNAMQCLFKQEVQDIKSMFLQPKHFLENIEKYHNAHISNEYKLYGSKKVKYEL